MSSPFDAVHRSGPEVFSLDTNVFDALAESDEVLDTACWACDAGLVAFEVTHVQEEQLSNIPADEQEKAGRIARVPRTVVPTAGFMLGVSVLGGAALDDSDAVDRVRRDSSDEGTWRDALIASTAARDRRVMVTDDALLAKRATAIGIEVWSCAELVEHLKGLASVPGSRPAQAP